MTPSAAATAPTVARNVFDWKKRGCCSAISYVL
jgi:hypothetical protein